MLRVTGLWGSRRQTRLGIGLQLKKVIRVFILDNCQVGEGESLKRNGGLELGLRRIVRRIIA